MIAVIGDFMIDHYLWGKSSRISPEAPVPVVEVEKEEDRLGGAGNVVNNLITLGADVLVSSVIGRNSRRMLKLVEEKNIDTNGVFIDKSRETIIKSRVIASHQQVIRYDRETINPISEEYENKIIEYLNKYIQNIEIILLSDYEKGVLTKSLTQKIIKLANRFNKKLIIDPKKDFSKYVNAWMLKPNKKELETASGMQIKNKDDLIKAGWKVKKDLNLDYLLVTLSEDGMALFADEYIEVPTLAREVYDVTGAGDTVLASLGFYLSKSDDLVNAMHFANAAAAVVVGKLGSATVTLEEIKETQRRIDNSVDYKIVDFNTIEKIANELRSENKKIVFTNGCFDILHIGHVKYLQKAKTLGDKLIVGVNSNESVKRLKGPSRPVNDEYDRAYLLASLEVVDYVVIFDEDTPYELIKRIKPDILVKGADYKNKEVVGSDIAKEVKLIDFVEGKSTTNIIKKVKNEK
ncbi:D-beta-D-heptose 7-phosphate kinase/D-beta-D-heptose 1-phosphate adenosyltransferase [Lebetimonas natsushimae]|uniref:Bifunctional protein HldE n=1 Tax=Lebetimonas natsushimae TaxID=1936991 RepID=A0A292YBA5_9BACT|nr:D-glycero-beta-D-manno-heptose-7-phosphate kinase [Lebetimonas natsushimae]GAX86816.1 D-beta-D-heptose 7-phosphate kinase/D-beta-D-heptose 1-phosphate adenosyltransferase [Lebetimonas natsushimae]